MTRAFRLQILALFVTAFFAAACGGDDPEGTNRGSGGAKDASSDSTAGTGGTGALDAGGGGSGGGVGGTGGSVAGSGGVGGGAGVAGSGGSVDAGGDATSDAGGDAAECTGPTDCPTPPNECVTNTCLGGQCGTQSVAAGTKLVVQTSGDCKSAECDGNGNVTQVNDNADVPVDSNICTNDVCTNGVPSNPPLASGASCGNGLFCNGTGSCVGCVTPADCSGVDDDCKTRTCISNTCGVTFTAVGTPTSTQTAGDCQKNECDGNGSSTSAIDDADLPSDANTCTDDVCSNGVPSNLPLAEGTTCPTGFCTATGQCVACLTASQCSGTDTACHVRTCTNNTCGVSNTQAGTATSSQTSGDCLENRCDGNGNEVAAPLDTDLPIDGNACTGDVCSTGVPSNPPLAGSPCTQDGGLVCSTGAVCTRTFAVVRLGDGAAALTNGATPVFLEKRYVSDGVLISTAALPTTLVSTQARLTLSGTASSEGALTRSANGQYLVLAGYDADVGTAAVAGTTSATVNRVVARVDAALNIDTSTRINALISANNVRSATTDDGTRFWVGGAANGAVFTSFGSTGGTAILANLSNVRVLNVFDGQLYGSSSSGAFTNVFTIGTGLPTTAGQTATSLPGMPTSGASPFAYVFFDRISAVPGLDTLFVADDRAAPNGGIQRWVFNGATWTLSATLNQVDDGAGPVFRAFRGVTGYVSGSVVLLIATDTTASSISVFADDGVSTPTGKTLQTAATNTVYRGIALAP